MVKDTSMTSPLFKLGLAALCSTLLASCAQSPTGRSQMLLFSPQRGEYWANIRKGIADAGSVR